LKWRPWHVNLLQDKKTAAAAAAAAADDDNDICVPVCYRPIPQVYGNKPKPFAVMC